MNKRILKIFKFLPILVVVLCLSVPTRAQAFDLEKLGDFISEKIDTGMEIAKDGFNIVKSVVTGDQQAVLEAGGKLVADALGIDTDTHCSEPARHHNCLFCPMFHIFFNASSSVARTSYGAFHGKLGELILIFLAVSLALIILKNVASMGARDPGTLMNELMNKAFICIVIYLIITKDYFNVLNNTLAPIIADALDLVTSITGTENGERSLVNHRGTPMGYIYSMGAMESTLPSTASGTFVEGSLDGAVMPVSIDYMIVYTINQIEQKIFLLFEYGEWAFCRGLGPDRIFYIFPNPIILIDGLLLYLGGLLYMVAYPWILADAILQLGISLALLPFAIAGFAFKGTKKYLPKVFNWILHSMFVFIFMAILINVVLGYVGSLLTKLFFYAGDPVQFFLNPVKGIAFYGANMIKIIFILAIGWIYMPLVRDLAGNFAKGTSLTPAAKVGDVAKNSVETVTKKTGDYAAKLAKETSKIGIRRFHASNRHLALGLAQRFGHTNLSGNKEFSVAGVNFISELDAATGKSILRREFTSITGRRHVMISDKLCTIKEEYDRNGNLIKRTVKFKYASLQKGLIDKDGKVDLETLNFVLNSRIGRQYRQAVMEQIAVDSLKAKGKNIGIYYSSRHVTFNPNNPTEITIEQIDHSGKITRFGLNINPVTGQTATSYVQDVTKTDPIHRTERKTRIWIHKMFIRRFGRVTRTRGAALSFDTFLGTHYEMRRDPITRKFYYVRVRRKYWLFGPSIEKTFFANRTQTRVLKSVRRQARDNNEMAKIIRKLNGRVRAKGFWYTYSTYTDAHGTVIYSRRLRTGWNIKNYARLGFRTSKILLRMPAYALKISTYPLMHPTKTARGIVRGIVHPVISYRSVASSIQTGLSNIYGDSWQTGNIENYSNNGATVVDSTTGQTIQADFNDQTTIKNIDGSKVVTDNASGETVDYYNNRTVRREVFFDNGVVKMETKSKHLSDGSFVDEKTKFQYSSLAQQGHDSILAPDDGHQVVEGDGTIARNLRSTVSGKPNPLNLTFGLDNIAGMTAVGTQTVSDFVVNDIFAEGRKRRTNKMRTNFSSFLH